MAIVGRKTKLTLKLIGEMIKYISNGNTIKDTCLLCDITEVSFYRWVEKTKRVMNKINNNIKLNDNEKIFSYLSKSIKKAQIQFKDCHLKNINTRSKDHWQASAWLLERKFPEEWGRKDRMDLNLNVEFDITKVSQEEQKRILDEVDIVTKGELE